MTKPTKSNDMRNELRSLMSQHTAMVKPMVATTPPVSAPAIAPVRPAVADKPRVQPVNAKVPAGTPKSRPFERCTIRLTGADLSSVDKLILTTHQHAGERITTTDLFRIALSRLAKGSPISTVEIQSLRATDRRRNRE